MALAPDVRPGVQTGMGSGDAWPAVRRQILAADIVVVATPIWLGPPSSVPKRALERQVSAEVFQAPNDVGSPWLRGR